MKPKTFRAPIPPQLALFFGVLAVSTASIFIRYAQTEASSLAIAAYRLSLAAVLLAPSALHGHRNEIRCLTRGQLGLAAGAGIFLAFHFAAWITSLEYTSVASSVVLVTTNPVWVALLSPILLKEKLSRPVVLGLLVTVLGGMIVGVSDSCTLGSGQISCPSLGEFFRGKAALGNGLALFGAWMAAGYLIIGRRLRVATSLIAYTFLVYGIAAIVLVGMALIAGSPLWGFSPMIFVWFLALAVIPQLLGHSTFNWALRYLPVTYVAIALLGEPVGSTILAYVLLHEVPGFVKIVGAAVILLGIWITSRSES